MKRGSSLRRHVRLARVSAKVRRERPEFARVYELVDKRSGGRCEVALSALPRALGDFPVRCGSRATEHHHTRKPRRVYHASAWIIHVCRYHHDLTTAAYRTGRLLIERDPLTDGFTCAVVQKAGKWAPS